VYGQPRTCGTRDRLATDCRLVLVMLFIRPWPIVDRRCPSSIRAARTVLDGIGSRTTASSCIASNGRAVYRRATRGPGLTLPQLSSARGLDSGRKLALAGTWIWDSSSPQSYCYSSSDSGRRSGPAGPPTNPVIPPLFSTSCQCEASHRHIRNPGVSAPFTRSRLTSAFGKRLLIRAITASSNVA
jgi:hypothetical protein